MMKRKLLLVAALVAFSAATAWSFTVSVNTRVAGFVAGRTSGHEEITRQALNRLEQSLLAAGSATAFAPEFLGARGASPFGTKGFDVDNKIIQGNYATDFPDMLAKVFDLAKWHGLVPDGWTNNPNAQVLHFLQNRRPDGAWVPQQESCNAGREMIAKITQEGVRLWRSGDRPLALFFFGHATHTIQDSFAPAHTIRADKDHNHNVLKICYYGQVDTTNADSCYHLPVDPRDGIWIRLPSQLMLAKQESPGESAAIVPYVPLFTDFMLFDSFKESALKHEARLARTATMRYLYLVAMYIGNPDPDDGYSRLGKILMENLFEGPTGMRAVDQGLAKADDALPVPMAEGIIRCDRLDPKASTPLPPEEEVKTFEKWGD